jgi:hypothetical protein
VVVSVVVPPPETEAFVVFLATEVFALFVRATLPVGPRRVSKTR